jgi:hypothetical protein
VQQRPQDQRQPDRRAQDGKLHGRVAGEIAGEGETDAGDQPGVVALRQPPHQQIGEPAAQRHLHQRFNLQKVEPRRRVGERQGQRQQQVAERIEDGSLHVGQKRMPAVGVRVPKRQASGQQLLLLKEAERQEMVGKVAIREGAQPKQDRGIEERCQTEQDQQRLPRRACAGTGAIWAAVCGWRAACCGLGRVGHGALLCA